MTTSHRVTPGWTFAVGGVAVLALLAVLPPVIGGEVGAVLYRGFSAACHQIPERSPHLAGGPIALCHRCSGILAGFLLGLALIPLAAPASRAAICRGRQGLWLLLSVAPTAIDWALGASGLWANTPASRVLTGMLFGLTAGVILGANLLAPRRSILAQPELSS